ncbi:glycosyltransferase [Photorhabdus asymbiotica UENP]
MSEKKHEDVGSYFSDDIGEQSEQTEVNHFNLSLDDDFDIYADISIENQQELKNKDNNTNIWSSLGRGDDDHNLKQIINDAFKEKLPQLMEYRRKGYNVIGLDEEGIKQLEGMLKAVPPEIQQPTMKNLYSAAQKLLNTLKQNPLLPENQDMIQQSNSVIRNLNDALEAMNAAGKVSQVTWEQEVDRIAREQRERLVAETMHRLSETGDKHLFGSDNDCFQLSRQQRRQRAEGLLFSEANLFTAEHFKFERLRKSLLAESRVTRLKLAEYLEKKSVGILTAARDAKIYAMKILLAQARNNGFNEKDLMDAKQVNDWLLNFQQYARHIPAVDGRMDDIILRNPFIVAVKKRTSDEPAHIKIARTILPVSEALGAVSVALWQAKNRVQPLEERLEKPYQDWMDKSWEEAKKTGQKIKETSTHVVRMMRHNASKIASMASHTLKGASDSEGVNGAVKGTALLLLDEIQQAERRIKLLPSSAWMLQEAVEQHSSVTQRRAYRDELPELSELLNEQLKHEEARWQAVKKQSRDKLQELIAPITRLAQEKWEQDLYFWLGEELRKERQDRWKDIQHFDEIMAEAVVQFAKMARELDGAAIRLAEHGHSGGKELQEKVAKWLRDLSELKHKVKTGVVTITGTSLDNFSRDGMLARGMSEWAEDLKQSYLQEKRPEDRAAAAELFERTLIEIVEENRTHFAKESDPEAKRFLKRLALALKHAAENATVYPPTPEEILAGSRSLPDDIRHWAEKKVVSGAISAAFRGGFKLVTGTFSLPIRVAIRSAKTGGTLYRGVRAINRSVRLGQGPATQVKSKFINQELSKTAFRLTLSLSPLVAWGMAASITAGRLCNEKDYHKKIIKNIVIDLPEELLWIGGYAGINAAIRAHAEKAIQQAIQNALDEQADKLTLRINKEIAGKSADVNVEIIPQETSVSPAETAQSTPEPLSDFANTSQLTIPEHLDIQDNNSAQQPKIRHKRDASTQILTDNDEHSEENKKYFSTIKKDFNRNENGGIEPFDETDRNKRSIPEKMMLNDIDNSEGEPSLRIKHSTPEKVTSASKKALVQINKDERNRIISFELDEREKTNAFTQPDNKIPEDSSLTWWLKNKWRGTHIDLQFYHPVSQGMLVSHTAEQDGIINEQYLYIDSHFWKFNGDIPKGEIINSKGAKVNVEYSYNHQQWYLSDGNQIRIYLNKAILKHEKFPHELNRFIRKRMYKILMINKGLSRRELLICLNTELTVLFLKNNNSADNKYLLNILKAKNEILSRIENTSGRNGIISDKEIKLLNKFNIKPDRELIEKYLHLLHLRTEIADRLEEREETLSHDISEDRAWNDTLLMVGNNNRAQPQLDTEELENYLNKEEYLAEEKNRLEKLNKYDMDYLDKKIEKINSDINDKNGLIQEHNEKIRKFGPLATSELMEKVDDTINKYRFLGANPPPFIIEMKEIKELKNELESLSNESKSLSSKLASLSKLKETLEGEKNKIKQEIDEYNNKYKIHQEAESLKEAIYLNNKKEFKDNDNKPALNNNLLYELALTELDLMELKIKNKEGDHSGNDVDAIKRINIAKGLVLIDKYYHNEYKNIIDSIKDTDIKRDYKKGFELKSLLSANEAAKGININFINEDMGRKLLQAIIYWASKRGDSLDNMRNKDINEVLDNYYNDGYLFHLGTPKKSMPEGYVPLSSFLSSDYFESQIEYNDQFNNYINKGYADYEAGLRIRKLILSAGISLEDLSQPIKKVNRYSLGRSEYGIVGELAFIQMHDGKWLFLSLVPNAYTTKIFTDKDMEDNPYLKALKTGNKDVIPAVPSERKQPCQGVTMCGGQGAEWDDSVIGKNFFRMQGDRRNLSRNDILNRVHYHLFQNVLYKDTPYFQGDFSDNRYFNIVKSSRNINNSNDVDVITNANDCMKDVLSDLARKNKIEMYNPSLSQKFAFALIPFYKEIYYAKTDSEYTVNVPSLVMDSINVALILGSAGVAIGEVMTQEFGSAIFEAVSSGRTLSLSGKELVTHVLVKLEGAALITAKQTSKILASALYDVFEPFPIRGLSTNLIKVISEEENTLKLVTNTQRSSTFSPLWRRNDINLDYVIPENGVYKIRPEHAETMQHVENFIKQDNNIYQVRWDKSNNTWRLMNPARPGINNYAPPVRQDNTGSWIIHSDVGLKGGGPIDDIRNYIARKSDIKTFNQSINDSATKWPPEPIDKNIHMIWIGTKNISEKNIKLSIDTAKKNPDYNTSIIYDSGINGHEGAKNFMLEKFKDSNVNIIDFRKKIYFSQLKQEPSFTYYEQAIAENKYAQASDILRLLVLKYEGGIYKDIDDIQVKGFGSLTFPKGIGVMREYAPEAGKATAFPNTPIAVTKNNPVINKTLDLAVSNYQRGEKNVLKLAGPDVFTQALYQEIPGLDSQVLNAQLDQFELAKRQALGLPLEKPKNFADEQLTSAEKEKINRPYQSMRGLSGYVENGADHSWAVDTNIPSTSTQTSTIVTPLAPKTEMLPPVSSSSTKSSTSAPVLQEKISYNLATDIDATDYLNQLKQKTNINNKISSPAGQCESLMKPVSDFMRENGFTDIRYRGMFIWNNATEQIPMNHFVVVGKKVGKDYVFDVSAHQFENKGMPDLNGPLILAAEDWAKKYKGATTRKLIYYSDFKNASTATNTYNALPRELVLESMEGKTFITSPNWYQTFKRTHNIHPEVTVSDPATFSLHYSVNPTAENLSPPPIPSHGQVPKTVTPPPPPMRSPLSLSEPLPKLPANKTKPIEFNPGENQEHFSKLEEAGKRYYKDDKSRQAAPVNTMSDFGNRYLSRTTEAPAPSNVAHLALGNIYNTKVTAKGAEKPAYDIYISKDGESLITSSSYKVDDITTDSKFGKPLPYSEIMFNSLKKSGVDPKNLKRSVQASIENQVTQDVISAIGTRIQRGQVIRVSPTENPEAFYTLLGTDNCKATLHMLNQHAEEFGHKVVTSIEFKGTGYLVMNIGTSTQTSTIVTPPPMPGTSQLVQ